MDLDGASVLLTGGSRGLGPHIARALLARGARVTLSARSEDDLERVRATLSPDRVDVVPGDVTNEDDRASMVAGAEAAFGPLDVLVNNAGIESVLAFQRYTEDDIAALIQVNLDAPIQLSRLAIPGMLERQRGHIVNMASVAGKAAVPYNTVYSATKHGLVGFTYSLRAELHGTGVSASVVCPGYVTEAGLTADRIHSNPRRTEAWTTPGKVSAAVVRAIERDLPDVVVSGVLGKLADVSVALSPRLTEAIARRTRSYRFQRVEAEAQSRKREG
ncbi:MAG TPA: SDR family NAD(P)-dependent oxidoreductase [Actinomycetota bacterium]|nr:SDR family NAD(P)-dependent oxidoreductase [Actinomycetota bacterium]